MLQLKDYIFCISNLQHFPCYSSSIAISCSCINKANQWLQNTKFANSWGTFKETQDTWNKWSSLLFGGNYQPSEICRLFFWLVTCMVHLKIAKLPLHPLRPFFSNNQITRMLTKTECYLGWIHASCLMKPELLFIGLHLPYTLLVLKLKLDLYGILLCNMPGKLIGLPCAKVSFQKLICSAKVF